MYKYFFKRIFDILGAIILIPFVLIFIILVSILFLFGDRGPILYKSIRLGKNMKPFKMYKIRTMKVNAPDIRNEDGSTFNSDKDPRVTKLGRILRKTSLDELPQIFNVLIGHMSFIGPRPDLYDESITYSIEDKKRFHVRPGITGYSQAYFRNSIEAQEKYKNDIFYVENLTFKLDLKVFFKTIISVVKNDNINKDGN